MYIQSEWNKSVKTRHKGVEYEFKPNQIKEVPNDFDINKVRHFKEIADKDVKKEKEKVKKAKEEVNLDLNNDGKVDGKDASIAGKVLANRRHGGK